MARGRLPPQLEGRCHECLLLLTHCVCAHRPVIDTSLRFIIVRHWKERSRPSNTGRIAAQCLPTSILVDHGAPGAHWDPAVVSAPNACLLFPDPDGPVQSGVPDTIVILDGSWSQARKMVRRVPGLNALPRLVLPGPDRPRFRLRRPPIKNGMATAEAIAQCLRHLGEIDAADALDAYFDRFVEASLRTRGIRPRAR